MIKTIFEEYSKASGQIMKKEKSQVLFLNTNRKSQNKIARLLEYQVR